MVLLTCGVVGRRQLAVFLGGHVFPVSSLESQPLATPLDVKVAISRPAETKAGEMQQAVVSSALKVVSGHTTNKGFFPNTFTRKKKFGF